MGLFSLSKSNSKEDLINNICTNLSILKQHEGCLYLLDFIKVDLKKLEISLNKKEIDMTIYETNAALGYNQKAILLQEEKGKYLVIDTVNISQDDFQYQLGKIIELEDYEVEIAKDYHINKSPLKGTFLFECYLKNKYLLPKLEPVFLSEKEWKRRERKKKIFSIYKRKIDGKS